MPAASCSSAGDAALDAGPGVYYASFGNCHPNSRGEALYPVKYLGAGITSSNQWATYFGAYNSPRQALRDGDPAPGFPAGITLWWATNVASLPAMNDVGDVVGSTELAGPDVTGADKVVLWLRHHVLQRWVPLLRSGAMLVRHTIYAADASDFGFAYWSETSGADGRRQSLNDLGMLAIRLEFTDATHGLFRSSPPLFGDADADGDVDATDLGLARFCLIGVENDVPRECSVFDLDQDADVDLADMVMLQQLVGP